MPIPTILALDFDGVLCDGMGEYFESSRRTCQRVWPDTPVPGPDLLPRFRALRPVILTGWEMPVLLRAIAEGRDDTAILQDWPAVRAGLLATGALRGDALAHALGHTIDDVRRQWIAADPAGWLAQNTPYCGLEELRRLVAEPAEAVVVTTKEGEFARTILDSWRVPLAEVHGKESGTHKCDTLRALIASHVTARGQRPMLWFIEDRLDTLQHVTTHADLDDVELFLAGWGYNTRATRAAVRPGSRIHLLDLDRFRRGLPAWLPTAVGS